MNSFHLKITTTDNVFFDGDAQCVIVRTTVGDKAILANHTPYTAALDIGKMMVRSGGKDRYAAHNEGYITTDGNNTNIVLYSAEWAEDIDITRAEFAKKRAEEKIKSAQSDEDLLHAELKLKRAINRLNISKK